MIAVLHEGSSWLALVCAPIDLTRSDLCNRVIMIQKIERPGEKNVESCSCSVLKDWSCNIYDGTTRN